MGLGGIHCADAGPVDIEELFMSNEFKFVEQPPEQSRWTCYMFGNRPGGIGIVYKPRIGNEPNWFARWMMRVCFDCLWVKEKNT